MDQPVKQFLTRDIFLAACIFATLKIEPELQLAERKRVIFAFPSHEDVYRIAANFTGNVAFHIQDVISTYKDLRQKMYDCRGSK